MSELPDSVHEEIKRLCSVGDDQAARKAYSDALASYWAAWDLLPEPKTKWEAATWILVAIGDANFLSADYVAGRDNLSNAMKCPGAIGNPFIHFRLGQCELELATMTALQTNSCGRIWARAELSSTTMIPNISVSLRAERKTYADRDRPSYASSTSAGSPSWPSWPLST